MKKILAIASIVLSQSAMADHVGITMTCDIYDKQSYRTITVLSNRVITSVVAKDMSSSVTFDETDNAKRRGHTITISGTDSYMFDETGAMLLKFDGQYKSYTKCSISKVVK